MQEVIGKNEIRRYAECIDAAVIGYIEEGQIETYESFANFDLIAFDWYDLKRPDVAPSQILIYLDREDIFIICEDELSYTEAQRLFTPGESNEYAMYLFFKNLLRGSAGLLEQMEQRISALDDDVADGTEDGLKERLTAMRNEVLRAKKYYEQLEFLLNEICDVSDGVIRGKDLVYFENLHNRSVRLVSQMAHLRDYLMQVRDSYQAQIGIEQNNLMKVFTMVTSIFLPLTLIAGWYGMNLKMPEFGWEHGYAFVACLCAAVAGLWIYIFKKKKWF